VSRPCRGAAVLALLLALVGGAPAAAQVPAPPPEAVQLPPPVEVVVDDLRPRAPRPGDDLQVLGSLRSTSAEPVRDLEVRVLVGDVLISRGQLRSADVADPLLFPRDAQPLPDLAPEAQAPLDLRLPVDLLRLTADGVYPLAVEVHGRLGDDASGRLGGVRTYVPWFGGRTVDPLRIAWLWPLVDQPRTGPSEVLLDDELATSLAAGGRLGSSLAAARAGEAGQCPPPPEPAPGRPEDEDEERAGPLPCAPVGVTYAVDPDLLSTAQSMSDGYEVRRGGRTRPGEGQAAARAWLESLTAATDGPDVVALPYADPDVVALTRGAADLGADVAAARTYGVTVTREVLGVEPLPSLAVPPPGRLTDAAFDAVTAGSTRAVALEDDGVVIAAGSTRSTPGARVDLPAGSTSGPITGLVVDRALSDLLLPERAQAAGARLAEQRWLVETAMISAELPARGRTLLVTVPRRGALDPALAGGAVVDTGAVPWMCPVDLEDVVEGRERCSGGQAQTAGDVAYAAPRSAELAQPEPEAPELAPAAVARLQRARADAIQLTGAVIKGGTEQAQALRTRMQRAWLRPGSSAWRDDRRGGTRLTALLEDEVEAMQRRVSVLSGRVTLTSSNGRVSVAVVNELDQPVTVAVELVAPTDARLSQTRTEVLEVPARTSLPVQVEAQTLTSGRFVVKAMLLDREGQRFGEPAELVVTSTRYGRYALAVTGFGVVGLLLAAGARLARRALGRRQQAAA